jgi:hypothetical protein
MRCVTATPEELFAAQTRGGWVPAFAGMTDQGALRGFFAALPFAPEPHI